MKSHKERAEEAQKRIVLILKELQVDIAPTPFIDDEGRIRARHIYIDTAPEKVEELPDQPKTIEQAIEETAAEEEATPNTEPK